MKANTTNTEIITITPIEIKKTKIRIVGDTPLIAHAWSEKARRMMLDAQQGKKAVAKKELRDPFADFIAAAYWMTNKPDYMRGLEDFYKAVEGGARFGFPVTAIKQAAQSAAYRLGWVKNQMALRGSFFIEAENDGLAEVHAKSIVMREDMVRVGMGTSDLRYRPQYDGWYMDLVLSYNASGSIPLDGIINAINAGGYCVGIGEWRPEKDGDFGRFHVEASPEA